MNFYKLASGLALSVLLVGVIYFSFLSHSQDKSTFSGNTDCFNNVITKIMYFDGNRGLPIIYLRDTFFLMSGKESKILHYIKVGDSVVKKMNNTQIYVYRKDSSNAWRVVVFK